MVRDADRGGPRRGGTYRAGPTTAGPNRGPAAPPDGGSARGGA
ncbi:hypothetical protein ACFPM0_07085 [Pseudonocardia sulfidoxydans]